LVEIKVMINGSKGNPRKKDRKDDLNYNGRHRRNAGIFRPSAANMDGGLQDLLMQTDEFVSLTASQQINRTASDELRDVYDQSFGSLAIIDFHSKFKHASKLLERYLKEEDLPTDCFTPRSLYLRGVSKAQLFRRRLLTRKENELLAMTLAHHGLGDVRMAPVMEVKCLKRFFLHYCEVLTFRIIDLLTKHLSPLSPTNYYLT